MNSLRTVVIFPGGGSHYSGMGKIFYEQYPVFRDVMDHACDILGWDLRVLAFNGSEEELAAMKSHPVIFAIGVGMYKVLLQQSRVSPIALAGHSLGEYCALVCADVLNFEDALNVVARRVDLLSRTGIEHEGQMMAVNKIDATTVANILEKLQVQGHKVYISNYNSPYQVVLSGNRKGINAAEEALASVNAQLFVLPIPTCSHCPLLLDGVDYFKSVLSRIEFGEPTIPVYSNLTGRPYQGGEEVRQLLPQHLLTTVFWEASIRNIQRLGVDFFVECGPGEVLSKLNGHIVPTEESFSYDNNYYRGLFHDYCSAWHADVQQKEKNKLLMETISFNVTDSIKTSYHQ